MDESQSSDISVFAYIPGTGRVQIKDEPADDYHMEDSFMSDDNDDEDDDDDDDDDDDPYENKRASHPDKQAPFINPETTFKYIQGDLTFEEYSSILEKSREAESELPEVDDEVSATVEVVSSELQGSSSGTPIKQKGRKKGSRNRRSRLPPSLQGLVGEANMRFARGKHEEAIKMCMEVIRQEPNAWEPFQTLAMISEDQGNQDKCLQYSLIAATLKGRNDADEWIRVAVKCLEMEKLLHAIFCYTEAIRCAPSNVELWWARSDLYEKAGEEKKAMSGYQHILSLLPKENADKYFQLTRDMAKHFHKSGETTKALTSVQSAFKEHPSFANIEDINLLIELCMAQKCYSKSVAALVQHCKVVLEYSDGHTVQSCQGEPVVDIATTEQEPSKCVVPSDLHIDLISKLVVNLIHCQFFSCAKKVGQSVMDGDPRVVGDLFLDIAEAYMDEGQYTDAVEYLFKLIHSDNYNNFAAVWLKYGECLNSTGEIHGAVKAYKKVVELAPNHLGARVTLSALHQQLGRPQEALSALHPPEDDIENDDGSPPVDPWLLLQRCWLLYSQELWSEFVNCAKKILYSHIKHILTPALLQTILNYRTMKHRIEAVRYIHGSEIDAQIKSASALMRENPINVNDLWDLYVKLAGVLLKLNQFAELEKLSIAALVCPQFTQDCEKGLEADFMCLTACIMNRNGHYAYPFIRDLCRKNINNQRAWNLFAQIVSISQDFRHNRFCLRLILKNAESEALSILNGHNALVAGTYRHALGEYMAVFKKRQDDPLICFCIALTLLHMASQKYATKRHSLVIQSSAFLNEYLELRGECQESYYNLGRAMHQLNLLHLAEFHYKKALTLPPAVGEKYGEFDLTREIAYNLMCIYMNSNSKDLAAHIMQQYLVI